jgi:hypothetical protein
MRRLEFRIIRIESGVPTPLFGAAISRHRRFALPLAICLPVLPVSFAEILDVLLAVRGGGG